MLIGVLEHPGVQLLVFQAVPERMLLGLVRACGEAVERDADVSGDDAHGESFWQCEQTPRQNHQLRPQ